MYGLAQFSPLSLSLYLSIYLSLTLSLSLSFSFSLSLSRSYIVLCVFVGGWTLVLDSLL